jgi:hypothetical protein
VTETSVNLQQKTFRVVEHAESSPPRHPMRDILFVVGWLDRADHFYEREDVDAVTCFGFDVSAKKYGDNPDGALHRVWFDAATNLPVRMEFVWPHDDGTGTSVTVTDQFQWDPNLPADLFVPQIPADFALAGD